MRRKISAISLFLAVAIIFTFVMPTVAFAEEKTYEAKELKAYLYSMEKTTTIECIFDKDLPLVPYIDPVDYLEKIYTVKFTQEKNEDGTYTVKSEKESMICDPVNDKVHFDNYENFSGQHVYLEGSMLDAKYIMSESRVFPSTPKALDLDLGKYGIDVIEYNGKVYLPLTTIDTLFIMTYNAAEYVNGDLYFLHTLDTTEKDGYFDRSSLYDDLKRDDAMVQYTYDALCFQLDHFYGRPSKAEIAQSMDEKGFDKTLDEYSDTTRKAKELLKSNDLTDFYLGLCIISDLFYDGGHTALYFDPLLAASNYPESEFGKIWIKNQEKSQDEIWEKAKEALSFQAMIRLQKVVSVTIQKKEEYMQYEEVKKWSDSTAFYVYEDTGIFMFDSFVNDVVEPFKWSLDYAAEKGLKRFVIDLSTNGGGSSAVLLYILAAITNKGDKDAKASYKYTCTLTGNERVNEGDIDLNLDGVYDEKDKDMAYDFDFGIITSSLSFSCGNLLPVLAKDAGIVILGETSGGGSCALSKYYLPEYQFYALSGIEKFVSESGIDADKGAAVDYDLRKPNENNPEDYDYSGLYDMANIASLMDEFYGRTAPTDTSASEPTETSAAEPTESSSAVTVPDSTPKTGSDATVYFVYMLIALIGLCPVYVLARRKK